MDSIENKENKDSSNTQNQMGQQEQQAQDIKSKENVPEVNLSSQGEQAVQSSKGEDKVEENKPENLQQREGQPETEKQGAEISSQNIVSAEEPLEKAKSPSEKREEPSEAIKEEPSMEKVAEPQEKQPQIQEQISEQNIPRSPKSPLNAFEVKVEKVMAETSISIQNITEPEAIEDTKGKGKGKRGKPKGSTSTKGRKPKAAEVPQARRSVSPRAMHKGSHQAHPNTRDRKKVSKDEVEKYSCLINHKTKRKKSK